VVGVLAGSVAARAADSIGPDHRLDPRFATLRDAAPTLDPEVLRLALVAHANAQRRALLARPQMLTIIDYALPSTSPRLWVLDLERATLLHEELVAHGQGSGANYATEFSNRNGSRQSSLGLFVTGGTYQGKHGYSLRLHGQEPGINDLAFDRTIVIHAADYVTASFARRHGRLGLSWGCPALRPEISDAVIDRIKDGTALFVYYPDEAWLTRSELLVDPDPLPDRAAQNQV
jgi:hypothetical protein